MTGINAGVFIDSCGNVPRVIAIRSMVSEIVMRGFSIVGAGMQNVVFPVRHV